MMISTTANIYSNTSACFTLISDETVYPRTFSIDYLVA